MKISRTLLSCAGTLSLITLSQLVSAQTAAPAAPAPIVPAPAAPAAAADAAPAPGAPVAAPPPAAADVTPPPPPPVSASIDMRPAPAVLVPPPPPVVLAAPVEPPAEKAEPLPTKLAVAKEGWLKFGALAQAWYVFDRGDNLTKDADSGKIVTSANYFRIRRAQIKFSGTIVPETVEFLVLADLAKSLKGYSFKNGDESEKGYYASGQDSSPLLDFNITFKSDYADATVGQWKSPISYEAGTSSSELLFPERTYAARYFGDNYDLGLKIEKKFEYVKYSAQVLQGNTANTPDSNKQKELALRLEFYPIEGVFVGGAGLASVGQRDTQKATREVIEVDAGYDKDGFLVRGEMLWGNKGPTDDDRTSSRGMSLSAAYTIAKKFQPAIRVGFLDVDELIDPDNMPLAKKFNLKDDEVRSYEVGFNYFIAGKNAKLQASYGYFDFGTLDPRHQVMLAAQVAY